jgi:hypothetical protein
MTKTMTITYQEADEALLMLLFERLDIKTTAIEKADNKLKTRKTTPSSSEYPLPKPPTRQS